MLLNVRHFGEQQMAPNLNCELTAPPGLTVRGNSEPDPHVETGHRTSSRNHVLVDIPAATGVHRLLNGRPASKRDQWSKPNSKDVAEGDLVQFTAAVGAAILGVVRLARLDADRAVAQEA